MTTASSLELHLTGAQKNNAIPALLPILPLRGMVVYPLTAVPLNIGQRRSINLIEDVAQNDKLLGLFTSHDPEQKTPTPDEIYRVGTLVSIHRMLRKSDGTIRLLINGLQRVRLKEFVALDPYLVADIEPWPEQLGDDTQIEALVRNLINLFLNLAEFVPSIPGTLLTPSLTAEEPLQTAYTIATYLHLDLKQAQDFLELDDLSDKLNWLIRHISKEIEILEMGQRIRSEAFGQMEQAQREYFLREQLKAIQRELGEADERVVEAEGLRHKIEKLKMPEAAHEEAERELARLTRLPVAAAEYGVVRTYLEWLTALPWHEQTPDNLDLDHARAVLDEDHHGLKEIKDRIIEYLAVRKLRQIREVKVETAVSYRKSDRAGAILCFAGPPGVGKTSLGRSIARAMGRKFAHISLGGMRDEAEIRGHRRTYIGAMPGQIIQTLKRLQSSNPVIILDEVDKIGASFRGDPASALLEVLDPEQNREFRDHYLDVPVDLSAIMFITTANILDTIPAPLRDRMEILQLSGYTETEKVIIAENYLLPRQIQENGLLPTEVSIATDTLRTIIQDYTREAGVRNLERTLARICRKVATAVAANPDTAQQQTVETADIRHYLGPSRYFSEVALRTQKPGVATGLSWTTVGGNILFIEAAKMPGKKGLTITGQLGEVMKESVQTALSYIRSRTEFLNIDPNFFENYDIHIHVPAGAIPKDGPSAGITIATAIASLITNRPVRSDVAMTGEITLRGQILPIGGLKEKVLAAHRAGLSTIILPKHNQNDLSEIPAETSDAMTFVLADDIDTVLEHALTKTNKKQL
ncbi:MAG: endopeptidase La [Anaerolineales bacterium]|nr:endopeptidase La [Anaerolineales bacterium]